MLDSNKLKFDVCILPLNPLGPVPLLFANPCPTAQEETQGTLYLLLFHNLNLYSFIEICRE